MVFAMYKREKIS